MLRSRLPIVFALLLGALAAFTSAPLEARPNLFDETELELAARRDGPLSGADLDKAQKKQLKAALKAIDLLADDSDASELKVRVKTLQKVAAKLRKPFKDEFGDEPGEGQLGSLLAVEAGTLRIFVQQQRDGLSSRIPATKVKPAQVQKQVDGADKALAKAAAATTIKKQTKALLAALAKLKKGEKLLSKLSSGGSGGDGLSVTILRPTLLGMEWTAATVSAEYAPGSGDLQIFATGPRTVGDSIEYTIFFNVSGVNGDGTYSIGQDEGQFQIVDTTLPIVQRLTHRFISDGTGSVTVTKLETGKPRIEGSFSFGTLLDSDSGVSADLQNGSFGTGDVDVR